MGIVLTIIHVIICFILIIIVLLQAGKGASLGSAFGGGGASQTAFGARRGNIFSRITTGAAILFMVTSLLLTVIYAHEGSIVKGRKGAATTTPPAPTPAEQTPASPEEKKIPAPAAEEAGPGIEVTPEEAVSPGEAPSEETIKIEEKTKPAVVIPPQGSEGSRPAPTSKEEKVASPKEPVTPKVEEKAP
ncbi:MAG: preprotein translocase subunit SecG [bacterium]|nr:preprotein translocase subunit SecG [bacterium]